MGCDDNIVQVRPAKELVEEVAWIGTLSGLTVSCKAIPPADGASTLLTQAFHQKESCGADLKACIKTAHHLLFLLGVMP